MNFRQFWYIVTYISILLPNQSVRRSDMSVKFSNQILNNWFFFLYFTKNLFFSSVEASTVLEKRKFWQNVSTSHRIETSLIIRLCEQKVSFWDSAARPFETKNVESRHLNNKTIKYIPTNTSSEQCFVSIRNWVADIFSGKCTVYSLNNTTSEWTNDYNIMLDQDIEQYMVYSINQVTVETMCTEGDSPRSCVGVITDETYKICGSTHGVFGCIGKYA